jgi:hypothetical protein
MNYETRLKRLEEEVSPAMPEPVRMLASFVNPILRLASSACWPWLQA